MEKQQTAVEWLFQEIELKCKNKLGPTFAELFEQAKQMEEKQMIEYGRFCVQCEKQGFIIPKNN